MDEHLAVAVLFVSSAIAALIAAIRNDWFPKVEKLALAVALAATAFFVQVTDLWHNFIG